MKAMYLEQRHLRVRTGRVNKENIRLVKKPYPCGYSKQRPKSRFRGAGDAVLSLLSPTSAYRCEAASSYDACHVRSGEDHSCIRPPCSAKPHFPCSTDAAIDEGKPRLLGRRRPSMSRDAPGDTAHVAGCLLCYRIDRAGLHGDVSNTKLL
ncbi:hypothetical protein BHE74_00009082 [Ensete ventricosum]|nr:hypothetical protein BHE74_00009082 [Ensete ventricosum]